MIVFQMLKNVHSTCIYVLMFSIMPSYKNQLDYSNCKTENDVQMPFKYTGGQKRDYELSCLLFY